MAENEKNKLSIFSKMSKLAKEYGAINLGQGFPNFGVDEGLMNLVNRYMHAGYNQYAPMPGQKELRYAISEKTNSAYTKQIDPETEVTITAGATQAIFSALAAIIQPGDEVIIFEPAYDSYKPTVELFGGIVCPIQLNPEDYSIPWDQVTATISKKTRLIIINNPHNPTGQILKRADLLILSEIVNKNKLYLLSDEVYEHLIYDNQQHESVLNYPELYDRSILTYSFGKTFHVTGWKLGYAIASPKLTNKLRGVHQWNVFSVNSFTQMAIAEYVSNKETYTSLPSFYQTKRDLFNELMKGSSLKPKISKGTYFQLFDYSAISQAKDTEFAEWLVREHKVACIPISPFYSESVDTNVVRICFAKTNDVLEKAAEILKTI